MIEAHRVPPVFTRPHNRQRTMLWTQEHKRDDNTGRAPLFSAAAPGLERVSHLIVYPPSLSPSSCAWTAPQKQGDDECSSLSVAEHNFHKMPTIFTKCPQSAVLQYMSSWDWVGMYFKMVGMDPNRCAAQGLSTATSGSSDSAA